MSSGYLSKEEIDKRRSEVFKYFDDLDEQAMQKVLELPVSKRLEAARALPEHLQGPMLLRLEEQYGGMIDRHFQFLTWFLRLAMISVLWNLFIVVCAALLERWVVAASQLIPLFGSMGFAAWCQWRLQLLPREMEQREKDGKSRDRRRAEDGASGDVGIARRGAPGTDALGDSGEGG